MATSTQKGIRKKPKNVCILGNRAENLEDAREELLLVAAVNYVLKHDGREFCTLIADIKSKSPPKGLQYAEAIAKNPSLLQLMDEPLSLDYRIDGDEGDVYVETVTSETLSPEEVAILESNKVSLMRLIDSIKLPPRNKEILCRRYGLMNFEKMNFDQLGPLFDITKERARQIVVQALEKLRKHVARKQLTRNHF